MDRTPRDRTVARERTDVQIRVEHDPDADAVYVAFAPADAIRSRRARTLRLDRRRFIDVDADGAPLGVEFLDASDGVDVTDVPRSEVVAAALRRRHITVLSPAA